MPDVKTQRRRLFGRPAKQHGSFAMIMPNPSKVGTAALRKVNDGITPQNTRDNWEAEAYQAADDIGEVGFVSNLKANTAAQCDLRLQEYDAETKKWVPSEAEEPLRVLAAFQGPQGGQAELIRRAVLHLEVGGETMMVGTPTDELGISTGLFWEFLSSQEIKIPRSGGKVRRSIDGGAAVDVSDETYMARCWRSDPVYSALSDSPVRRVLPICREIITLNQQVYATIRSRLAAGLLYVPDEITFYSAEDEDETDGDVPYDEDDENAGIDDFIERLIEHMSAPIKDRTSAASLVPLVMRGPAEFADSVKLIDLARDLDTYAQEIRKEALNRLAAGLDIDPSIIAGKSDLNHWVAYAVDAEFVLKHVAPTGRLFADFVTVSYLRPMLEVFEDMSEADARRYRIVFDPAPVMARTDESQSSRLLHEMDLLSDESTRSANGFDESDAPEPEELTVRRLWRLFERNPLLGPVFAAKLGLGDLDWSLLPANVQSVTNGDVAGRDLTPPDAVSGEKPPPRREAPPKPQLSLLTAKVSTAADSAVHRAMERAAARVVSKARGSELAATVRDVPKTAVLASIAPADLAALDVPPSALLDGAWEYLARRVRTWVRLYVLAVGGSQQAADDTGAFAATALCNRLDEWLTSELHTTAPAEGVPESVIAAALADAGLEL